MVAATIALFAALLGNDFAPVQGAVRVSAPIEQSVHAVKRTPSVQLNTLHIFSGGPSDGSQPNGPLIKDAAGDIYGTTSTGGSYDDGTVYELNPPATGSGAWTENILYTFEGNTDGNEPEWGVISDSAGNLYGTTVLGGQFLDGNVFELSPPPGGIGPWTERILHTFRGELDGQSPASGVTMDASNDLFGETPMGGKYGLGTIYELTPPTGAGGQWTEKVLYSFRGGRLGANPIGLLTIGTDGALYGAAETGGKYSGVVYRLAPPAQGKKSWTYQVIYDPVGRAGYGSVGSFIVDASGSFLSSAGGGAKRGGTVFRLSPPTQSEPRWTSELLATFPTDGALTNPEGPLTLAADGSIYGVSAGSRQGEAVFHLLPPTGRSSKWTIDTLYDFTPPPYLTSGLVVDAAGDVFGAALQVGSNVNGIVYELTP